MTKPFFFSDPHWGHPRICQYSNRPFGSLHEMNQALIENWNSVVHQHNHVYVLGDVSFTSRHATAAILQKLKGKKFLVAGNHDSKHRKQQEFQSCFEWVKDYHELHVQDAEAPGRNQLIVLFHYPIESWNKARHGSWHLHGHTHGSYNARNEARGIKRLDVGVDVHGYKPVSYEQIKAIMATRQVTKDHHEP
jgi:calcineurin-like phosphoesterase family protein